MNVKLKGDEKKAHTIQSVDRALDILEAFGDGRNELGVTELSKMLGLHKSTAYGLLTTLEVRGYLVKHTVSGKYRLGLKLFELGNQVQNGMDLKLVADQYLEQLLAENGETVHLVIMDGGEAIYIDKKEGPESMRMVSQVGKRLPVHCSGVGKTLLAHLPEPEINSIIAEKGLPSFTAKTITDPDVLKKELQLIRDQGYALDNEEISEGLMCIAVPIRNHTGNVIAALSVAGPTVRMKEEKIENVKESVLKVSRAISYRLGYKQF